AELGSGAQAAAISRPGSYPPWDTRLTVVPTPSQAMQTEGGLVMPSGAIPLAKEIDRVPSSTVPLDHAQEQRFQRLMDPLIMVDVHVHPMVLPDDMEQLTAYLR